MFAIGLFLLLVLALVLALVRALPFALALFLVVALVVLVVVDISLFLPLSPLHPSSQKLHNRYQDIFEQKAKIIPKEK